MWGVTVSTAIADFSKPRLTTKGFLTGHCPPGGTIAGIGLKRGRQGDGGSSGNSSRHTTPRENHSARLPNLIVYRCFRGSNVFHPWPVLWIRYSPSRRLSIRQLPLRWTSVATDKSLRLEKVAKSGDAKAKKAMESLHKFKDALKAGQNARAVDADEDDMEAIRDIHLLTIKPVLYVANVDEGSIQTGNAHVEQLQKEVAENAEVILLCAALEAQIAEFDDEEEKEMFLGEYGLKESGLNRLIAAAYRLLNLITYFTAGVQEVRAWTIKKGWKAPAAAGVIHTDFEKGFIKAEVIKLKDYQQFKTEATCRENGKIAVEGKEYVVCDGDIMHFRFNV